MLRQFSLLLLAFVLVAASPPAAEQLLTDPQIEAYQKGIPPSEIVLTTGETLEDFLTEETSTPTYELAWIFVSGGGTSYGELPSALRLGSCSAGTVELVSTIGQPVAGVATGGGPGNEYELWIGLLEDTSIFSDGFECGDVSAWSSSTPPTP